MAIVTKQELPELFLRYLPAETSDRPRSSHRIHEHAEYLSSSRTGDQVRNRSQYPALMAVMVSSPRLVYPSVVKISDM